VLRTAVLQEQDLPPHFPDEIVVRIGPHREFVADGKYLGAQTSGLVYAEHSRGTGAEEG